MVKFSNFRIGTRIYAGFGAVILVAAGIAGLGAYQLTIIDNQLQKLAAATDHSLRNVEVEQIGERLQELGIASIDEVSTISTTIAAAVEEQGAATAEIARNVAQTAKAAQDVTTNIGGVSQAATENSPAASQVLSSAGDLSKQAEDLAREVNSFVADVRAA